MKRLGPKTRIARALERVNRRIERDTDRSDKFSRGLAREGYLGGYADALMDVQLALGGTNPKRSTFWDEER